MNSKYLKKINIPDKPGVYFFKKGKDILYIGKATFLKNRIRSYFSKDLIVKRGPIILDMVTIADSIEWKETDSVLEALILEANLIKKNQPKYNTKEKDNKSFNYVCITKEEIPKVLIIRGKNIKHSLYKEIFGPFPNGLQLREAMKIIRRIFPFIDNSSNKKNNIEFYRQLGLVPNQEFELLKNKNNSFKVSLEYKNNIKNLKLFFQGKKKNIISNLKKEMMIFAKKNEFEKAGEIKKRIFALNHINDIAMLSFMEYSNSSHNFNIPEKFRIEAYDIAHLSGKNMVGVMTVIENRELSKNEYRKFIVKTQDKSNDTGALEEILSRRMRHLEWGLPNLIVMDGSTAQINIIKSVLDRYKFKIPIVSVVKDDKHKAKAIIGDQSIIKKYKKDILLINNESHRFAITFHKKRRNKSFLI